VVVGNHGEMVRHCRFYTLHWDRLIIAYDCLRRSQSIFIVKVLGLIAIDFSIEMTLMEMIKVPKLGNN
jgi:hypothetical protein